MSGVDDRIVSMKFDNDAFEQKLSDTIASINGLTDTLNKTNNAHGLDNLTAASNSVDLSNVADGVQNISSKFSAMGAIGFAAIQKVTQSIMGMIAHLASLASQDILGPIITGGKSRAQNIEQAKFQFRGLGMDVDASMQSALDAVKGTAYGLDAAAKVAAQFGASGIAAGQDMTDALRGISGAAAMTGTSFEEMGSIYTGIAGMGRVTNQDLMQFATRGLNAAAAVGKVMGKSEAEVHEMATNGTLDFKTFAKAMDEAFGEHATKANETFSGSLANMHAAMSRLGASFFGPEMEHERDIFNALTPVIDNVTTALKPLIGVFLEMDRVTTGGFIKFLGNIDLTNFTKAVELISKGLGSLFNLLAQFKAIAVDAFRDIFPASQTSTLVYLAEVFQKFMAQLKMGGDTVEKFKSIFKGLFSILAIVGDVLHQVGWLVVNLFQDIASALGLNGSGILDFFANMGDSLTALKESLVDGGKIENFFSRLGDILAVPLDAIKNIRIAIQNMFSSGDIPGAKGVSTILGLMVESFHKLGTEVGALGGAWDWLAKKTEGIRGALSDLWTYVVNWFSQLGKGLAEAMKPGDFDAAVGAVNVGLIGGIALLLKNFLNGGWKNTFAGGIINTLNVTFKNLTGVLKSMQQELKAKALLKIAAAVGILAASMVVLSTIDSAGLTRALTAMAIGFGQLVAVMALMDKLISSKNATTKLVGLSTALILMATAMDILASAVKKLSGLSWGELAKGLVGISVGLNVMVSVMNRMSTDAPNMIAAGVGMTAMAVAMRIMANAVKAFGEMSWSEIGKGLVGVAAGIGILTIAANAMPSNMILTGPGLIAMATGLRILANAVSAFADMSWSEMGKGLLGIAGALVIVAGAMHLMPLDLPITASGLVILGGALLVLSSAVVKMGDIKFGTMAKGIGGIAAVLAILVVAVNAMDGALPGAAATAVVAGSLVILAGVMKTLGDMKISQIVTGLAALVGIFFILASAGIALEPIIPALLGLGAAMALVGGGFALFGGGVWMVAKGLQALIDIGPHGIGAITDIIKGLVSSILDLAKQIAVAAPLIVKMITVLLKQVFTTIITLAPDFAKALIAIITNALLLIQEVFPKLLDTGALILITIMQGIRDHIGEIITLGVEIIENLVTALTTNMAQIVSAGAQLITSFLGELANHTVELVTAGANILIQFLEGIGQNINRVVAVVTSLITSFLAQVAAGEAQIINTGVQILIWLMQGISDNLNKVIDAVGQIITNFLDTLGENTAKIIDAGFNLLKNLLFGIANNIIEVANEVGSIIAAFIKALGDYEQKIIDAGADVLVKFIEGIERDIQKVIDKGVDVAIKFLNAMSDDAVKFTDKAGKVLTKFLNGMAEAIRNNNKGLREAGKNIASAIIDGVTFGISGKVGDVVNTATDMAKKLVGGVTSLLESHSPSKVFIRIGQGVGDGLAIGIGGNNSAIHTANNLADQVVNVFQKTLEKHQDLINQFVDDNGNLEATATITPVIDQSEFDKASKVIQQMIDNGGTSDPIGVAPWDRKAIASVSELSTLGSTSIGQAKIIAATDIQRPGYSFDGEPVVKEVKFEQHNYSPVALSVGDIYRSTNSQIALAKEKLGI